MLKLIGAVLVIGVFCAAGVHFSIRLQKRCKCIEDIISAFEVIKSELSFNLSSVCEMMDAATRVCKDQSRQFFEHIHKQMSESGECEFNVLWENSLYMLENLDEEDKKILSDAAAFIGRYDAERQISALNYAVRRLNSRLHQAEKDAAQKAGLYRALGMGAGVITVLLVL